MKNGKIFLPLALMGVAFFGCQKETPLTDTAAASQPYVVTVIQFTTGGNAFEMSAVRQETSGEINNNCAGAGCGNATVKDIADDWTTYSAGNLVSITRQDDAFNPAYRMSLLGTIDLQSNSFPMKVANARIALHDFNGTLIQPGDDPAYSAGALSFEGNQDAVQMTVTSRTGNVVEGTFGGLLKMVNGSAIEIQNGSFKAQLRGL